MPSSYLSGAASPKSTPQSEKIPGSSQVENAGGGFAWQIDSLERLRRFCILGTEGGTYYASQRDLSRENIDGVRAALDEHGVKAVEEIVAISVKGRAAKQDPVIYALALAAAHKDESVRKAALDSLGKVCRTGTQLFLFAEFVQAQRGWGPALCKAVASWYEREDVGALSYQLVKYRNRGGWSHRDMLRLSHPKAPTGTHKLIYDWVCGRSEIVGGENVKSILAFQEAQKSSSAIETAALITGFKDKLPREALNADHLSSPEVWEALLNEGMPMTALIRNLANLTRLGVIAPMSAGLKIASDQLSDKERLRKARVHPMSILFALATYKSGRGFRGQNDWTPVGEIVDALDAAFYDAFENVEPSGKRHILALDVSGSMNSAISGSNLSCMEAAVAMALVTERVEPWTGVMAFDTGIRPVAITSRQRLDDAIASLPRNAGGTDCSLPMRWAAEKGIEADVFVVVTDNETWAGPIHPSQALKEYRQSAGIDAKLVVVGMTATGFSIADPNDIGMLDCVGFDTSTPKVIADFARS